MPGCVALWRQFPLNWVFWWILIPNLMAILMWPVGGPSMAFWMFGTGTIALLCSQHPSAALRASAIVAILLLNVTAYIALSFNIEFYNLILVPHMLNQLNPMASPEYVVGGAVMLGVLLLAVRNAPRTARFATSEQWLLALAAVALLVNVDSMATATTRGSYRAVAPAGRRVDSAIARNQVTPGSLTARNLVVIMVESMGMPVAAEDEALFAATWNPARWSRRYEVSKGTNPYYGSTTDGELRELCGVWADHRSFDFASSHCLPEQFREAGFRTIALHSFDGAFFDRRVWYPKIGFDERIFGDDLAKAGARFCGGVFPGVCDRDVPRIIGDTLRRSPAERNLVYWLTVNGHLPVIQDARLDTTECRMGSAAWRAAYPGLCRNLMIHQQIADAVTAEIMRPDFPEADVLIVGDHMPPFFPRDVRMRFDPARVPWIYLRSRAAQGRNASSPLPSGT